LPAKILQNFYFRNLLAIVLIGAGYALYIVPQYLNIGGIRGFCLFRSLTGIPCPGCGMGRATVLISNGEIYKAFQTNPLAVPFAVAALIAIVWIMLDLIRKKETFLPLMKTPMKRPYLIILLAIIAMAWLRNILTAV